MELALTHGDECALIRGAAQEKGVGVVGEKRGGGSLPSGAEMGDRGAADYAASPGRVRMGVHNEALPAFHPRPPPHSATTAAAASTPSPTPTALAHPPAGPITNARATQSHPVFHFNGKLANDE